MSKGQDKDIADGRTIVLIGQFALRVEGDLPLELGNDTIMRIDELIFDDLKEQGLVPGSCVNIDMGSTLFSVAGATEELRVRARKGRARRSRS